MTTRWRKILRPFPHVLRQIATQSPLAMSLLHMPRGGLPGRLYGLLLICYQCRNYESFISFENADRPFLPVLRTGYSKERDGRGRLRQRSDPDRVVRDWADFDGAREGVFVVDCMRLHGTARDCMGLHGTAWDCMGLHGTSWDCMAWDCMRLHEAGLPCLHDPIRSDRSHTIIVDDMSFLQLFQLTCSQSSRLEN